MAAALAPRRQPLGALNASMQRNLQSLKNTQNSINLSKPSLKRGHISLDLSDSENVDPITFGAAKRKRVEPGDEPSKTAKFAARPIAKPKARSSGSSITTQRPSTPKPSSAVKPETHWSAPAARSPPRTRASGITSRRTRLNASSLGRHRHGGFSLASAINNAAPGNQPKANIGSVSSAASMPKSWFFDIYEYKSPEEEKNAQTMFTGVKAVEQLDISDDEGSGSRKIGKANEDPSMEEQDKENIAPDVSSAASTFVREPRSVVKEAESRKDMMTDEPRSPLGELRASDYYAEGLDATSVVLVEAEEVAPSENSAQDNATSSSPALPEGQPVVTPSVRNIGPDQVDAAMTVSEITSLLTSAGPQISSGPDFSLTKTPFADSLEQRLQAEAGSSESVGTIDIWESDSAKEESSELDKAAEGLAAGL